MLKNKIFYKIYKIFHEKIIKIDENLVIKKSSDHLFEDIEENKTKQKSKSVVQTPKKDQIKNLKNNVKSNFASDSIFVNEINSRKMEILSKLNKKD